ncbi:MAG: hypothetical protein QF524_02800, partial [Planctomycetota bacterium]|nr:hypothetical protein [Planctomycetota bacterium]
MIFLSTLLALLQNPTLHYLDTPLPGPDPTGVFSPMEIQPGSDICYGTVTSANGTQSPALQKIQGGTSKLPLLPGHTLGQVTALGYNPNEQFPAGFSGDTSGNSRGVFWALNSSGAWVPNDIGDLGGGNAQILGSDKEGDWLCGWADVLSSNGQTLIPRPFVYNIIPGVIIDLNPGYQSESKSFDCDIDSNGKVTAVGHIYSYLQYPSAAVFEPGQAPSLLGGTG